MEYEYHIIETELAEQDFDEILGYLVGSLGSPSAAVSFAEAVERCYTNLKRMPLMFGFCQSPQLQAQGYRKAVIRNYIMVYQVDEVTRSVIVTRFFHGSQDYEGMI